jgi:SAM-dependent methyltransferase
MSYYDNVNTTVLDLIGPDAARICELGCGGGALAQAIRAKLPHAVQYAGIELMPDALDRARPVLDIAIQCDLNAESDWSSSPVLSQLPAATFDHLICGDVLEHLYDPQAVLQQACTRLAPGGKVVACIPNVQHWSVWVQLAIGSWPRQDSGLFDRTHIRWFTLNDMVMLMQGAGLVVETVVPRVFQPEQGQDIMEYMEPLARHLGVDADQLIQRGLPLQYVLVSRKPA